MPTTFTWRSSVSSGSWNVPSNWITVDAGETGLQAGYQILTDAAVDCGSSAQAGGLVIDANVALSGTLESNGLTVGDFQNTGTLVVNKTLSLRAWHIEIGVLGTGYLDVENGSVLRINTPSSFVVGDEGTGYLNILSGASLYCNSLGLGNNGVGLGHAIVDGQGSYLNATTIDVGGTSLYSQQDGNGTLIVSNGGVVQASAILIGTEGFYNLGTGSVTLLAGTIIADVGISADSSLTGDGMIAGGIFVLGDLTATGGVLTATGDVTNYGTISALNGTLAIAGSVQNRGTLSAANGGQIIVTGSPTVSTTVSISVDATSAMEFGSGSNLQTGVVTVDPGQSISGTGVIGGNVANYGTIDVNGGRLVLTGNINDSGLNLIGSGATLGVAGLVVGGGVLTVESNSNLVLEGSVDRAQDIDFLGTGGTLTIGEIDNFDGVITGFQTSDTIDLSNVPFPAPDGDQGLVSSFDSDTGILTINRSIFGDVTIPVGTLAFGGAFSNQSFVVSSDGDGGTDITMGTPSPTLAILAALADATYTQASYTGPGLSTDDYTVIDGTSDKAGLLADAFRNGNQIVIAFRGTDPSHPYNTIKNLLADTSWASGLLDLPSDSPNSILTQEVKDAAKFLDQVRQLDPEATLTLTGHSLGGAVAQLLGNTSGYATVGFNAPGARQFVTNLTNAGILAPAKSAGDGIQGRPNDNFRMVGDQVSLAGTIFGDSNSVWTLPEVYPDDWASALANHSIDTVVTAIDGAKNDTKSIDGISGVPAGATSPEPDNPLPLADLIQPITTVLVGSTVVLGIDLAATVIAAVGAGLSAIAAAFVAIDPSGALSYQFVGDASSPNFSGFSLPGFPGIESYNVNLLVNGSWQATQSVAPGEILQAPLADTGIRYSASDAAGNPVALPDGYILNAAFASVGEFKGTLSESLASPIDPIGGLDNTVSTQPGDAVVTGTTTAPDGTVVLAFDGIPLAGPVTVDGNGRWTYTLTAANLALMGQNSGLSLTATATDAAGNPSVAVTSAPFAVDTIAPALTLDESSDAQTLVVTLNGTGDANATVVLDEGATQIATATANASGVWSVALPNLIGGLHAVTASETDLAGNTGIASLSFLVNAASTSSVTLHGQHADYELAVNTGGVAVIQDTVADRDGSQTISTLHNIVFTDGIGRFDATGNAEEAARLYQAALNRLPDPGGLDFWTAQLDSQTLGTNDVALEFIQSAEFNARYGSLDNQSFVQQLYQNVLGRAGESGGLQFWTGQLDAGTSRAQVLVGFSDSMENKVNTSVNIGDKDRGEAYRLYQAAFARTPDSGGLNFWTGQLDQGAAPIQVGQGFVGSGEFAQLFAGLGTTGFVDQLYQNVLHRAADAGGEQFWVGQLNAGTSQAQVLLGFSDSLENRLNTSSATHDGWVYLGHG
jgi:Domain of unknown function (DUF4214)/Bacterial Ig-like domain/Lipase (class 3)